MVSPLVALQDEMVGVHSIVLIPLVIEICLTQVESFKNEYGITAVAINSAHGGCSYQVMRVRP